MNIPLAHFLKPKTLNEIIGQKKIIGKNSFLRKAVENDNLPSMIFYGPPGTGKTSLACVISEITKSDFKKVNAVSAGITDLRNIIIEAQENQNSLFKKKTILFIDEIHRFNKKQQDFLLPFVEDGTITLIGATTENPSFEVNSALLSRTQVFVFKMLQEEDIVQILKNGQDKLLKIKNSKKGINDNILKFIAFFSHGDARFALNIYELALQELKNDKNLTEDVIKNIIQNKALMYDKNGQEHYNIISALHKSMRDSDPDAAAYWALR
ncbi:MAG: AAA family ATPase, partial [Candidatus Pacebacteria bacterium]|nr:AAA family ATPase [Candidatus Paceibacterota bacterium]